MGCVRSSEGAAASTEGDLQPKKLGAKTPARHATKAMKADLCTPCGEKHDWKRWHAYTPTKKYFCDREGCGFFKMCWAKCTQSETSCNGCHVIGHKRWTTQDEFLSFKKDMGFPLS